MGLWEVEMGFRESVTCLTKLRVGCAAVVARMVWLLPGLGRRDKARLATTWACSCMILTFSSVTVSSVSPSTASVRGDTTYDRTNGGGRQLGSSCLAQGPHPGSTPCTDGEKGQRVPDSWFSHRSISGNNEESGSPRDQTEMQMQMREVSSDNKELVLHCRINCFIKQSTSAGCGHL